MASVFLRPRTKTIKAMLSSMFPVSQDFLTEVSWLSFSAGVRLLRRAGKKKKKKKNASDSSFQFYPFGKLGPWEPQCGFSAGGTEEGGAFLRGPRQRTKEHLPVGRNCRSTRTWRDLLPVLDSTRGSGGRPPPRGHPATRPTD